MNPHPCAAIPAPQLPPFHRELAELDVKIVDARGEVDSLHLSDAAAERLQGMGSFVVHAGGAMLTGLAFSVAAPGITVPVVLAAGGVILAGGTFMCIQIGRRKRVARQLAQVEASIRTLESQRDVLRMAAAGPRATGAIELQPDFTTIGTVVVPRNASSWKSSRRAPTGVQLSRLVDEELESGAD